VPQAVGAVRIRYWTTAPLEPGIEAVSKEVAELAEHFGGCILSVSPHLSLRVARRGRVLGFNPAWDPLLRVAIPLLERAADVNHVYAEVSPWIYHKTLRRRPIVLTIASEKGEVVPEFVDRCSMLVAQTRGMKAKLEQRGVPASKLRLIYPGIDLGAFRPRGDIQVGPRPRVLLATFPRTAEELEERGVLFLLQVAREYPTLDFTLLSRPWRSGGTAGERTQALVSSGGLTNVTVRVGAHADMRSLYLQHDFCVIPYTVPEGGKECPRSLVESLACGVPVLISEAASLAGFVQERDCGEVFALTPQGFAVAVEAALARYRELSAHAVREAHAHFDSRNTMRGYAEIYAAAR
jgi:glycosyltransferase involved in cell wall biosynthesis